ncbi:MULTISPECIES: endolytic transglycosylase MltG [Streptomyces]|uniref:endolytic transglycosylase MltG n=1 Tax=Streptomyces TaxID=1883 RepID=UPI00052435E7|nr:endolytic transglycosylase MltG [[Kitasatospora] papulosa]
MTEYGRGPGSEPWHPEDPLYGDQGWGHQAAHGQGQGQYEGQQSGQGQYDGRQQPYAQDPYAQQGYQQDPYAQQPQQQDPYAQQQHQQPQQHDPYAQQHQHQPQQYGSPQDPYAQPQQPHYDGGWDTGQQAAMPYGAQHQPEYGNTPGGYGDQGDHYATPEAYPPPQPPGRREEPAQQKNPDWDPEVPQEETHPFFTGADEPADTRDSRSRSREDAERDEDDHDDDPRESRRGGGERRGKGKKKSRNGCACLGVAVVLVGGLGGVGYVGYSYYQNQFGAAPDYEGSGTGSVDIEIPDGAYGNEIASILKKAGVVKSVDAFISAQNGKFKGKSVQAGSYILKKEMSAESAFELLLDPKSQNGLMVAPGTRNASVYEMIDKKLDLKIGTTAEVAKKNAGSLGLPEWADNDPLIKDPLEGFLYPATYSVSKGTKPEAVLKKMVGRATVEYDKLDLEETAAEHDLDGPWQVLTVASLVQAEGKTHDDFRKMSEVIYNRLKPTNTETNQLLQFDSTFNYLKKQSKINISVSEIHKNKDPYNTYTQRGLTPGPIGNPGTDALAAAKNPTADGWIYFVATDGQHKTEFAKNYEEFLKLKEKFDALE